MRGLFRDNLYASVSNAKVFSAIMLLLGVFVTAMDNKVPSLIIGYMLLGMMGFPVNAAASLRKEGAGKWGRYRLTAPVKRADIVMSRFLSLILWLSIGIIFAGAAVTLSVILHGFPFDRGTDVFMLFVTGVGISLFMAAVFFPLFYLGGEERSDAFLVASLLCGIGAVMGLTTFINSLFPDMTNTQVMLGGGVILACAALALALSYPLAVAIYLKKEY